MSAEPDVLLTVREVMALTKFKESTVRAKVRKGELPPPLKFGHSARWSQRELSASIEARQAARDAGAIA